MTIAHVTEENVGDAVAKINAAIDIANRPYPFFGPPAAWARPALGLGGDGAVVFDTWLNGYRVLYETGSNGTPEDPGTGYVPGDTITLAGGTLAPGGARSTLAVLDTKVVSAAIVAAGTGGTPGASVVTGTTGAGTLFQLNVTIDGGGGIESIDSIAEPGYYSANPDDITEEPVTDEGGLTGATVSVEMGVADLQMNPPMQPGAYSVIPANPVAQLSTSGVGTGATFTAHYSALPTATDHEGGLPLILKADQLAADRGGAPYLVALLKDTPAAAPWSITVALAAMSASTIGPDGVCTWWYPLVLYDSNADKAIVCLWFPLGYGGGNVRFMHFDDTLPYTINYSFVGDQEATGFPFDDYFEWFKVEHDGTNLIFSISPEGALWFPIWSEPAAGFLTTIDKVGFGLDRSKINTLSSTNRDAVSILWQWAEA